MRTILTSLVLLAGTLLVAQTSQIKGQLQAPDGEAIIYANVALYATSDSSLIKVETTDENGVFRISNLPASNYRIHAAYLGAKDLNRTDLNLTDGQLLDLGVLQFETAAVELATATVKADRAMVEVKPDRTVFNVQGTINSAGEDAISLLRKAPGVTVDNNDNINVLGRAGVLLYVDGKRLPLQGDDLKSFLQGLRAEQIDRIDIITNPGAKYEAEGNAGIIDIRLKKDKNLGANGSVTGTFSRGQLNQFNGTASGNYRNTWINTFGSLGLYDNEYFNDIDFTSYQNGLRLVEENRMTNSHEGYNYRWGADFFLSKQHTIGILINGFQTDEMDRSNSSVDISNAATPTQIDSILNSQNITTGDRRQTSYNLNYRFDAGNDRSLNIDLDYGKFRNDNDRLQPNRYFNADETELLTEVINTFQTPTDIDIYTFKLDYEAPLWGGKFGTGTKFSKVVSENTFLVNDRVEGVDILNLDQSNIFEYDEMVYAGYLSYNRPISKKLGATLGLRAEQTDATGDLQAFRSELEAPPVEQNYLQWFPSAGVTYQVGPQSSLALNYGRRINRPDYNVLNPFNNQLSQLTFEKGNPFLQPEIVNNIELGYTLKYRYNFKLSYSRTTDQITRLIAPDEVDARANFISWENLANQTTIGLNISAPVQIRKGWNAYFNLSASHLDNQADYGEGAVVDVQAFNYVIFQQHTFDLPWGLKGEVSGYYSGPGVWGGVFEYDSNWSLDIGLQKKFLNDALNVRLSGSDLFYQSGWSGISSFDGLLTTGSGNWDSRRIRLSIGYNFGNQQVKSRRRQTGLEDEARRVGG